MIFEIFDRDFYGRSSFRIFFLGKPTSNLRLGQQGKLSEDLEWILGIFGSLAIVGGGPMWWSTAAQG